MERRDTDAVPDADTIPSKPWVREPAAPEDEPKKASPTTDDSPLEEPGYGHGV